MKHPPVRLRRFPPLSQRCALRAEGRSQRGGAALAREPWCGPRQCHVSSVVRIAVELRR